MRLVDADALMREFAEFVRASNNSDFADDPTWNDAVSLLDSAPTIAAEPVKHGRWEETEYSDYDDSYRCSACGEVWEFIEGAPKDNGANYCPNCGARMDEVEDGRDND